MEETAKKQSAVEKAKLAAINAIDENGNGKIDLEDVIISARPAAWRWLPPFPPI